MITLAKYNELISKLTNCVNQYDRMNYQVNRHILSLANGDVITIKFLKQNIAHLLGVKIDYLKQANKFKDNMNNYDCLKYFIEENYTFSKLVNEGKLSFDNMFSKRIDEKLESFIDNIKIRTDDMEYIIKYDREKSYKSDEIGDICDYYIVRKIDGAYNVLGIKKNDKYEYYQPVSSRKYSDFYEYDKFMKRIAQKQEMTYPYTMQIRNDERNFSQNLFFKLEDKQVLLDKMIKVSKRYDSVVSVARDYAYVINSSITNRTKQRDEISILQLLSDRIKGHTVLDTKTISSVCGNVELTDEMKELIKLYNDLIVSDISSTADKTSYSEVVEERDKSIKEIQELKQQLSELKASYTSLEENNKILQEENELNKSKLNIYDDAFQKVKSM